MINLSAVRKERNRNIKVEICRHDTLDNFIFNQLEKLEAAMKAA